MRHNRNICAEKSIADSSLSKTSLSRCEIGNRFAEDKDPRLLLSHICHAFQPEAVVYVGVKWQNESTGLFSDSVIPMEYFILFAPQDSRNLRGACHHLKNSRRARLKAVLRALQAFAASRKIGQDLVVHTEFEVLPHRFSGELRRSEVSDAFSQEQQGSRVALSPDLVLQIEELVKWLAVRGTAVKWKQYAVLPNELEEEYERVEVEHASGPLDLTAHPGLPMALSACPSWYFMRVYTDGSTICVNGTFSGGYGVYFGYFDPRSECGPINGKGTGPRASLVAIVRALELISKFNNGHRRWEIACNREQYITCVFELTQRWKQSGWKRNSGKPIANLDLYRGARRIIDKLIGFDFELRGTYVPQKDMDRGIMVADLLARRGAGDQTIDLPFKVNETFEVPQEPEDMEPSTAVCIVDCGGGDVQPPRPGADNRFNGTWSIKFGKGAEDPRDRSGSSGSQSRTRTCTTVLVKLLRIIEGEHKRSWIVYVNFNDILTRIFDQLSESLSERPERRERHDGRLRSSAGLKFVSTPYIDALSKRMRRLERHGYDIKFRPHSDMPLTT